MLKEKTVIGDGIWDTWENNIIYIADPTENMLLRGDSPMLWDSWNYYKLTIAINGC